MVMNDFAGHGNGKAMASSTDPQVEKPFPRAYVSNPPVGGNVQQQQQHQQQPVNYGNQATINNRASNKDDQQANQGNSYQQPQPQQQQQQAASGNYQQNVNQPSYQNQNGGGGAVVNSPPASNGQSYAGNNVQQVNTMNAMPYNGMVQKPMSNIFDDLEGTQNDNIMMVMMKPGTMDMASMFNSIPPDSAASCVVPVNICNNPMMMGGMMGNMMSNNYMFGGGMQMPVAMNTNNNANAQTQNSNVQNKNQNTNNQNTNTNANAMQNMIPFYG